MSDRSIEVNKFLAHLRHSVEPSLYPRSIDAYLRTQQSEGVLRPHQERVMEDLRGFFEQSLQIGQKHGRIKLPTGTGKTVIFVELCKALLDTQTFGQDKPKILVVTPTIDLVYQTIGNRSPEGKGFGEFAPDISVGSYFSDTTIEEKAEYDSKDVLVTTYASITKLASQPMVDSPRSRMFLQELLAKDSAQIDSSAVTIGALHAVQQKVQSRRLDSFDVVIFDEAHHSMSKRVAGLIDGSLKDKYVIGFTATPDADDDERQLEKLLPYNIHEMGINEAIELGLLSPVIVGGISSGLQIRTGNIYDENGDYLDSTLKALTVDEKRNDLIVSTAQTLTEMGIPTIISCIAGDDQAHPQLIAKLLQDRGVRASALFGKVKTKNRSNIYKRFNRGGIDALTYIKLLGEGWDSSRAQALINARPTRSPIVAEQRLGRILRPEDGKIAFGLDIIDDFEENPPITLADVLGLPTVSFGEVIGSSGSRDSYQPLLTRLSDTLPIQPEVEARYLQLQEQIRSMPKLRYGALYNEKGRVDYTIPSRISSRYRGITEEIIAKLIEINHQPIDFVLARTSAGIARTVYRPGQITALLDKLPEVNPSKYFIDHKKVKWISDEGLAALFSKRIPNLRADTIRLKLASSAARAGEEVAWQPARKEVHYYSARDQQTNRWHQVIKLYRANPENLALLEEILSQEE